MDKLNEDTAVALILQPPRLWTVPEILESFDSVPKSAGIYAWYFDKIPPNVPIAGCHTTVLDQVLLYIGIAPKQTKSAVRPSTRTLRDRLRDHLIGNAEGSTLRRTLGCLLAEELSINLRRVGSGRRYTFTNPGEIVLDKWLAAHAYVAFAPIDCPWAVETKLLSQMSLPLNLSGNGAHPFASHLKRLRSTARLDADSLPIIGDSGGLRRVVLATPQRL